MASNRAEDERPDRIDALLEELRLNTEDLYELAKQAADRARESRRTVRSSVASVRVQRASRKATKKPENGPAVKNRPR